MRTLSLEGAGPGRDQIGAGIGSERSVRAQLAHEARRAGEERLAVRVVAFAALATYAALEYATLLTHAPIGGTLVAVAVASAAGAVLASSGRLTLPARLATSIRLLVAVASFVLGLLAIGLPAHVLLPDGWHALARGLEGGVESLKGWLWPYRGTETWPRVSVMAVVPLAVTTASCLWFWPSRRWRGVRTGAALLALGSLLIAGVVNGADGAAWQAQGLLLAALLAAWLWAPSARRSDGARGLAWLGGCAALALVLAPALAGRTPWLDYRAWDPIPAPPGTAFQWDELYGPLSWPRSPATMLQIGEARPSLLRVTSLDSFDGLRFLRSDAPAGDPSLDVPSAAAARRWGVRAFVRVANLRTSDLVSGGGVPLATQWLGADVPGGTRAADDTVLLEHPPHAGSIYTVTSYDPTPPARVLRAVGRTFPSEYLPYVEFDLPGRGASAFAPPNLAAEAGGVTPGATLVAPSQPGLSAATDAALAAPVEASPYAPVLALARRLAAGAPSSYDVAMSIERYLLANYTYDENVAQARYPLVAFLLSQHRGYCQQFSGAMALMLRMDGIPARVGVGFLPGTYDAAAGSWTVHALDAHAWVEVFFTGIGWVTFDPTPPRPVTALASAPLLAKGALLGGQEHGGGGTPHDAPAAAALGAGGGGTGGGVRLVVLALAGLAALLAVVAALRGRSRLRAALDGDGEGAVSELAWALARLRPAAPGVTLARLQRELNTAPGGARAGRYLAALSEQRYAPAGQTRASSRDRAGLRRALSAGAGPLGRLRALLVLPPGMARRASGAPRRRRGAWRPARPARAIAPRPG